MSVDVSAVAYFRVVDVTKSVVGVEPGDPVGGFDAGGERGDRCLVAFGAQDVADAEAVDAGHHDVEDQHVEVVFRAVAGAETT